MGGLQRQTVHKTAEKDVDRKKDEQAKYQEENKRHKGMTDKPDNWKRKDGQEEITFNKGDDIVTKILKLENNLIFVQIEFVL